MGSSSHFAQGASAFAWKQQSASNRPNQSLFMASQHFQAICEIVSNNIAWGSSLEAMSNAAWPPKFESKIVSPAVVTIFPCYRSLRLIPRCPILLTIKDPALVGLTLLSIVKGLNWHHYDCVTSTHIMIYHHLAGQFCVGKSQRLCCLTPCGHVISLTFIIISSINFWTTPTCCWLYISSNDIPWFDMDPIALLLLLLLLL